MPVFLRRLLLLLLVSCLDPTQVAVEITTDFDCIGPTKIETSSTVAFDGGFEATCHGVRRVGSIVFVPGAGNHFALQVTTRAPDGRAIVARRSLGYLSHTPLRLPILMSTSCAGVECAPTLTCVRSSCVPYEIDPHACTGDGCDERTLMDSGLVDSGSVDAADAGDAGDAAPTCKVFDSSAVRTCGKALEPLTPFSQWHFDELSTTISDPVGGNGPIQLPQPYARTFDNSFSCDHQLFVGQGAPELVLSTNPEFKTPPFELSFYLRSSATTGVVLSDFDGSSGWVLQTTKGLVDGGSSYLLALRKCNNGTCEDTPVQVDVTSVWHRVKMAIDSAGFGTLDVDGVKAMSVSPTYLPSAGPLRIGYPSTTFSGEIDELYFYCR